MNGETLLKRIDNPEGHQVCQVDKEHRAVAIQNKHYMTVIRFLDSGELSINHQKVVPMRARASGR